MSSLDEVLGALESQPWPVRCRIAIRRHKRWAEVRRVPVEHCWDVVAIRDAPDGLVELAFERALHEPIRERLDQDAAIGLLLGMVGQSWFPATLDST